jgi:hypothetical protein
MHCHIKNRQGVKWYNTALAFVFFITTVRMADGLDQRLLSLKELTQKADYVFIGDCVSVRSYWNSSRTMIFTEIKHSAITNDFIFKGSLQNGNHSFVQPGGQVDNIKTVVSDQPSFAVGDRSLLFLYRADRIELSGTVGASFGKIPIHRDPKEEIEFIILWTPPDDTLTFYSTAPSPAARRVNLTLQDVKTLITAWSTEKE